MMSEKKGGPRVELDDDDSGVWLVTTASGSIYRFRLDDSTVERIGGEPRPAVAPSDSLQSLRSIIEIRVGRRGRWWIRNEGGYLDPTEVWQWSSVIVGISSDTGSQVEDGSDD